MAHRKTRANVVTAVAVVVAATLTAHSAVAAPGDLDPSFDGDGLASAPYAGRAIAVQADGKIVVGAAAGSRFVAVRYRADGRPDIAFNGRADTGPGDSACLALAIQDDGKIVMAGYSEYFPIGANTVVTVARLNTDGSLDTTFGGGVVETAIGTEFDGATAVAVQSDGKILVAGVSDNGGRVVASAPAGRHKLHYRPLRASPETWLESPIRSQASIALFVVSPKHG